MKKINLLIVAGVLVSSLSLAGHRIEIPKTTSGMAVVKTTSTSFKLIYKSEEATDVKVRIFNSKNTLVFSETIRKSNGFARPYNFENLSDGEYTIKLDNGSNSLTQKLEFHTAENTKLAHLTHMKDGKYLLSVAGKGEDRLSIRIFNERGELVLNQSEPVYGNFAQVYDLRLMPGPFSFEISDKNGATKVIDNK